MWLIPLAALCLCLSCGKPIQLESNAGQSIEKARKSKKEKQTEIQESYFAIDRQISDCQQSLIRIIKTTEKKYPREFGQLANQVDLYLDIKLDQDPQTLLNELGDHLLAVYVILKEFVKEHLKHLENQWHQAEELCESIGQ